MNYEQISAFLGGTVGTLIVKGLIDYFSKNKDHRQQLEKKSYERKLEVGEAAIAFFSFYRYNVINMRSGLKATIDSIEHLKLNAPEEENGVITDLSNVQISMERVGATITEMFGSNYQSVLSMNLYFDFPESSDETGEQLTSLFTAIGQAKATDNNIAFLMKQADDSDTSGNVDAYNYYYGQALAILPAYKIQIETILRMLEQDVVNTVSTIKSIKEQIKIY